MGRFLVVDGGRSRCRVAVIGPDGVREAVGEGRGLPTGDGVPALVQAIGEAVALCSVNPEQIDAISAGLAGLLGGAGHAPEVAEGLARLVGLRRVVLTGDVVTAYAGALGAPPRCGGVAGTGAVALGVAADAPGGGVTRPVGSHRRVGPSAGRRRQWLLDRSPWPRRGPPGP